MPLCCPECGTVMKKRLDKPNYKIHKKCHDCVVEEYMEECMKKMNKEKLYMFMILMIL